MPNNRIIIKGTNDGLIITIGAGALAGLVEELDSLLGQKASFFKGGRVALRIGSRQLTRKQLENIGKVLNRHNVSLWAVESDSPGTQEATAQLGLEVEISTLKITQPPELSLVDVEGNSIVIQRTIRSGQVVSHPGHIVIIGDVNPGAEIKAGGSILVWGRLRGTAQAGTKNDKGDEVVVCALQLSPTQLRIGSYITRSPTNDDEQEIVPEIASVQDGQIVAESWK